MDIKNSNTAKTAANNFISALRSGEILVEKRPNHGNDFQGGYEQLYKKIFNDHLSSSSRYLINKRIKEIKYYG